MAGQLREAAEEITRIEQELTSGLEGVDWTGPDADRFRGQWSGEMIPALHQIVSAVNDLGDSAERNAAEQEATSATCSRLLAAAMNGLRPGWMPRPCLLHGCSADRHPR